MGIDFRIFCSGALRAVRASGATRRITCPACHAVDPGGCMLFEEND
jgi:hypothetical protein